MNAIKNSSSITNKDEEINNSSNEVIISDLVSLKTSVKVMLSVLGIAIMGASLSFLPTESADISQSISSKPPINLLQNKIETSFVVVSPALIKVLIPLLIITFSLFIGVFTLYVLAKVEGQRHGEKFSKDIQKFTSAYFPSVAVIESSSMLYVLFVILISIIFITKLKYQNVDITKNENLVILACAMFAILGGGLSHLYYFLNKMLPENANLTANSSKNMAEFDINKVLRYLSFPFMSGGMGIMAYVMIKGSGEMLGIQSFITPSFWLLMLMSLISGYFSNLFIEIFRVIVVKIKEKINLNNPVMAKQPV